jgi:hypothetical protein
MWVCGWLESKLLVWYREGGLAFVTKGRVTVVGVHGGVMPGRTRRAMRELDSA